MSKFSIPERVSHVTQTLQNAGFEAYIVGGCVRDLLMGKTPKDWDITTNATPEEVIPLFEKAVHENTFGMVAIIDENEPLDSSIRSIEVTTYRFETTYSNKRHPDSISFSKTLEEDLKRRDFTMNSIVYDISKGQIIDPFKGQEDIKDKTIRTVGKADDRFGEDALRILRAVRFVAQLGFTCNTETLEAIKKHAKNLGFISAERIRDEFEKIIMSENPMLGLELAEKLGVLHFILPELEEGIDMEQNKDHIYDVWTHLLKALQNGAKNNWPLHVRLAALFHDVGKPATRRFEKDKNDYTFYGHEVVGARMTKKIMERLKFPKNLSETVVKLVRYHMFFSDVDQITLSAVRRIIKNVGPENVWDLMRVRKCDRIGMGRPKESPYRLRKYESMIEEAMRDPVSVKQLKINGEVMMKELGITAGPRMGWMLHTLLEEVLDDPSKNTFEHLSSRVKELDKLSDKELKELGEAGKERKEETEEKEIEGLRKKHGVK